MVQTPLGAKSNPWIAYMKECRLNYNAVQNEGKRLTVVLDTLPEGVIKKKILQPTPKGSKDRVDAAAAVDDESGRQRCCAGRRGRYRWCLPWTI
mgnify:CR=1 FL=1